MRQTQHFNRCNRKNFFRFRTSFKGFVRFQGKRADIAADADGLNSSYRGIFQVMGVSFYFFAFFTPITAKKVIPHF